MSASESSAQPRRERPRLGGRVDPAFRAVGERFAEALVGPELGAALTVIVGGRPVVELWGGFADRRRTRPWRSDTLVCGFSTTKAVTAMVILDAVAEGALELDAPLVLHWPAFAGDGREDVTLRQVLAHRAGLPGYRREAGLAPQDLLDPERMTDALTRERPFWTPGEAHGYHARTFGLLLGEVLRRATGETVGTRLRRRLTGPRALDLHIGLPMQAHDRCAELVPAPAGTSIPEASRPMVRAMADADTVTGAAFSVPAMPRGAANTARWREIEQPAMNGHTTASGLAGLYAALIAGDILTPSLLGEACREHSDGEDRVLLQHSTFGLGFMLSRATLPLGFTDAAFGHPGAGGSLAFADPSAELAFAFLMNRQRPGAVTGNETALALLDAVRECLA
ncbi:MAG: serine hydrolase domain-containing protein [Pseudomonadales bacterium]|jgi:CubicO group peptidase (beta-lactamase class C family)|nr:serine hydrolase domain-containing protein [Pseudomonadales bacterium]